MSAAVNDFLAAAAAAAAAVHSCTDNANDSHGCEDGLDCFLQVTQPTKPQVSPPVLKQQQQQLCALLVNWKSIGLQQHAARLNFTGATLCSNLQRTVLLVIQLKPAL